MDLDPDGALEALPVSLDREEAKTTLILAVGLWVAAVEALDLGPLVASGLVGVFVALVVFLLDTRS